MWTRRQVVELARAQGLGTIEVVGCGRRTIYRLLAPAGSALAGCGVRGQACDTYADLGHNAAEAAACLHGYSITKLVAAGTVLTPEAASKAREAWDLYHATDVCAPRYCRHLHPWGQRRRWSLEELQRRLRHARQRRHDWRAYRTSRFSSLGRSFDRDRASEQIGRWTARATWAVEQLRARKVEANMLAPAGRS